MVAIVLGIAAVLIALPGGYLLHLSIAKKYPDNLREARARLTGRYVRALADLHSELSQAKTDKGLSIVEILLGESHFSAIREMGEILAERDTITDLYRRMQSSNLYARYVLLALVVLLLASLTSGLADYSLMLIILWGVIVLLLIILSIAMFYVLFKSERQFDQLTLGIIFDDEEET